MFPITSATKVSTVSWCAGVFGVVYIVLAIMLVPRLGPLQFSPLLVAGQL